MSIRRYTTSAWKPAAFGAATVVFLAAMIASAERGWHAPHEGALVPLFAFGILSGIAVSVLRARSRALGVAEADDDAILEVTSARPSTYALAAIAGVGTSLVSGVALGLAMGQWTQLFLASLIGALYMATWPLQVIAAHAVFAGRISIGIDGVRVGRRHLPFHALARVTVDARDAALVLEPHDGAVVRHRCGSIEAARDLREMIEERLASRAALDAATLRMARAGRTVDAWRRELLGAGYRGAAITPEAASQILGAAGAAPDERVGAALVIAGRAEGEERERARTRIRVAAAACVDRRLRVALERVAEDTLDDAALEALAPRPAKRVMPPRG